MRCPALPSLTKWVFVAVCAANAAPVHLEGQEFHVDLDADNTVLFRSSAAIEVVEGRTDRIDGYIVLDSERVEAGEPWGPTGFYLEWHDRRCGDTPGGALSRVGRRCHGNPRREPRDANTL